MNAKSFTFLLFVFSYSLFSAYSQKELEMMNDSNATYLKGGLIKSKVFNQPKLIKSIHPDSLLKSFYPGAFYRYPFFDTDTFSVVLWYCDDAKPELTVNNDFEEDTLKFIDTVLYDSRFVMCDTYTDSLSSKYAWVAMNTTEAQPDLLLTGRFCSGILSLALLKLYENGWSSVDFNIAMGTYGMFCMSPKPEIVEYKKGAHGLQMVNYIGGFGGPFWGSYSLFDCIDGKITELLLLDMAGFEYDESCSWDTKITKADSLKGDELMLVTEGKIDKDKYTENEDLNSLPTELVAALEKKKNLSFSIQRIYKWVGHKYELRSTRYKIL